MKQLLEEMKDSKTEVSTTDKSLYVPLATF